MSNEILLEYLHSQKFRNLLLETHKGSESHKRTLTDVTRLIAAYFLDFPLFLPKIGENLPSLFVWCELKKDDFHSGTTRLDRSDVSNRLSPEFGPKFAAVMLVHLGLSLEAILYSDYFNDHRTALILRVYADNAYGFNLFSDHCFSILNEQIPKEITRIVTSSRDAKTEIDRFGPAIARSLLELDIVFNATRVFSLETFIVGKIEFLFAELPVNCAEEDVKALPRPPVYLLPNLEKLDGNEGKRHLEMHAYIQLFFECLHQTNRLHYELHQLQTALAQYDTQFQPRLLSARGSSRSNQFCSKLVRVLLLVLRVIYRDTFSLAISEQWDELPSIAAKYKSLMAESEDETDMKAFERWFDLAGEQDLQHVSLFIQYVWENFQTNNTLPSFCNATREIWLDNLLENSKCDSDRSRPNPPNECDWLMGHIRCDAKIGATHYREMRFLASSWSALPLVDRTLISLRLSVQPSDICVSKSEPTNRQISSDYSLNLSARLSHETSELPLRYAKTYSDMQPGPSRRRDLISEYARKGEKLFGKRYVTQLDKNPASRIQMNRNLRERLRKVQKSQREIESELEEERSFIESAPSERPRRANRSPQYSFTRGLERTVLLEDREVDWDKDKLQNTTLYDQTIKLREIPSNWTKRSKKDAKNAMEETIKDNLTKLNDKLDEFNKIFHSRESSSMGESQNGEEEVIEFASEEESQDDRSVVKEPELEVEEDPQLEPEEGDPFDLYDVSKIASSLPEIEKLDFSQLSPPPDVGKRPAFSYPAKIPHSARASTTDYKPQKTLQLPEWMRLIPLEPTSARNISLLKHDLGKQYSKTERACQTTPVETILRRQDSGYNSGPSLKKLEFVREMSNDNISNMLDAIK